ncbi:MAG: GntR family transcriptional regulator [Peptoniphilaceae bacterium]|nr:GntR family transcriptional regulator [Peptoniphilaceae bacterium]
MAIYHTRKEHELFELNFSSQTPLYLQIVKQTRLLIAKGILQDGDAMPSVRELSKTLLVNTSTVSKAYKALQDLGIMETRPGTGSFICIKKEMLDTEVKKIEAKLLDLFLETRFLQIPEERIKEIYDESAKEVL